jgi:DNA primase
VSPPLAWDELTDHVTPERFTMAVALERLERLGDLFEPTLAGGQSLGEAKRRLGG